MRERTCLLEPEEGKPYGRAAFPARTGFSGAFRFTVVACRSGRQTIAPATFARP